MLSAPARTRAGTAVDHLESSDVTWGPRALGALLATVGVLGAPSAAAPAVSAAPDLFSSGTLVAFRGTSLQCLVFGPISSVEGKWGVMCFKGKPKQWAEGTRWVVITPQTALTGTSNSRTIDAVTSKTTIRFNIAVPLDHAFEYSGLRYTVGGRKARLQCRYVPSSMLERRPSSAPTRAGGSRFRTAPGSSSLNGAWRS